VEPISNRWLFLFAAVQAIGAVFSILSFFGITFLAVQGHVGWLVAGLILLALSILFFSLPFRSQHITTPAPANPVPNSSARTTVSNPTASTASPIGAIPVATESTPISLGGKHSAITTVRVGVGDYREFLCEGMTVRISVKRIDTAESGKHLALLDVHAGGRIVYGSEETKKDAVNQFIVPQKSDARFSDEQQCSLYFYTVADEGQYGQYFRFFRAYVDHINAHAGQVVLNVFSYKTRLGPQNS
jgi:hypothetical protein